jgi:hypothetical protein
MAPNTLPTMFPHINAVGTLDRLAVTSSTTRPMQCLFQAVMQCFFCDAVFFCFFFVSSRE